MTLYTLSEILERARSNSPFYRDLFSRVHSQATQLQEFPITPQSDFWAANTLKNNQLLTGPLEGALVFKSGGTSGHPKFSVFTHHEWRTFTQVFGQGMNHCATVAGDRVANLFYAGDLYASFLFIHDSMEQSDSLAVNFPITGSASFESLIKICEDLSINTLAGVPTTLMNFVHRCDESGIKPKNIRKFIFGGESMYPDQRSYSQTVFPGLEIRSIGYASVDGGLLGYADSSCEPDVHRCFAQATMMEIVDDDTHEVIHEIDRPGRLLLTNLTRKLMPIIRYPVGDRAIWLDPPTTRDRRFKILGRSDEAARLGPVSIYFDDLARLIAPFASKHGLHGFQFIIQHEHGLDTGLIRIGATHSVSEHVASELIQALQNERKELLQAQRDQKIGKITIEFVPLDALETNARTGKLKRIIDLRKA